MNKLPFKNKPPFNFFNKKIHPKQMLLWLFIGCIAVFIPAYGIYHFQKYKEGPPPIPVETKKVHNHPYDHILPAIGILQANEAIMIRSEVAGRITNINFMEGQSVEKDQLLISLEDSIEKANLKESEAEFKFRKLEFTRADTLLQRGAGSATEKDTALSKLEVAEALFAKAQSTLSKMSILAPFGGYTGIRKVNIGDFITEGQDLVHLVDLDPIKLDFRIPEIYLEQLKLDQTVDITTDALPNRKFAGRIYAIDPQIDPLGHSILIRAIIDNNDFLLRPGLFARIQIIIQHMDNALFIPPEALIPRSQKHFVYRLEDNRAVLTEVRVGERKENEVEIVEGLTAEDIVITAGQMKVSPGAKIIPLPYDTKKKFGSRG